jgi:hypothetical protein
MLHNLHDIQFPDFTNDDSALTYENSTISICFSGHHVLCWWTHVFSWMVVQVVQTIMELDNIPRARATGDVVHEHQGCRRNSENRLVRQRGGALREGHDIIIEWPYCRRRCHQEKVSWREFTCLLSWGELIEAKTRTFSNNHTSTKAKEMSAYAREGNDKVNNIIAEGTPAFGSGGGPK